MEENKRIEELVKEVEGVKKVLAEGKKETHIFFEQSKDVSDIDKGMISHMQYKGHNRRAKMLYIPLNDTSRDILERWKGKYEEFVFGLLPSGYDLSDDADFKKVRNAKDRTINQSLKSIGDKMGLPFNLHMHLGRHTFAMMALNGGVDIKTTSSLLGHASTMVTERVYATLLPNTIAERVGDKLNVKLD